MSMQLTGVLYFVRSLALLSLPRVISALHALITADHLSATVTASRERFGLRQNGMIPSRRSRLANLARLVLWNNPTWCSPSIGALLGLVMVEWNVAVLETRSVGIWDTHLRVGGAMRIKLLLAECLLARIIQTESPYSQCTESTTSPGPFEDSIGLSNGDPGFASDKTCEPTDLMCDFLTAVTVESFSIASTGLCSRFDDSVQL